jgi:Uma2 family endonuclease
MSAKSAAIKAKNRAGTYLIKVPDNLEEWVVTPRHPMSDEDFWEFCARNRDLRLEMTSEGQMIIMMPVGGEGSNRNFLLTARLGAWAEADGTGIGFDSSGGFRLPNKAKRSPDASWVRRERWEALTDKQRKKFPPLCPDFVIELRSESDRLKKLQDKMEEYIANGAQLGWLIDPIEKKVYIYRPNAPVEILDHPQEISGEPLLKGFTLKLAGIID